MTKIPMWRRHDRILGPDPKADIKAELRFHIECKTEDLIAHGWLPEAARSEAERQFGNILAVRTGGRAHRRAHGTPSTSSRILLPSGRRTRATRSVPCATTLHLRP